MLSSYPLLLPAEEIAAENSNRKWQKNRVSEQVAKSIENFIQFVNLEQSVSVLKNFV
jgi:hypothetical protein